ncbi:extensin family protein [Jannaschia sp. S6380]|uniref:extensin-like domain-containing protein n=1 Tax=Jannaschia sp. S6380 TaxID=2926408 RepID=UPI001FF51693|nr:extensin family protein [Jannaschia sp. S6380]MCK0168022.1 extensin family protein [Jannaschia sp. S6380]
MRWMILLAVLAAPAGAEPRPVPRPAPLIEVMSSRGSTEVPAIAAVDASVRPVGRLAPETRAARAMAALRRVATPRIDIGGKVRLSWRPATRPAELILAASRSPRTPQGGGLCGRPSLQGAPIAPVTGPGACGIPDAVRVTHVAGLALSRPARMDCTTAQALDDWVRAGVLPAVGRTGGGAVALDVAAGYACRTRNSRAGARLSEHARGHAIDISGIRLANGGQISVLRDWNRGGAGQILRTLWKAACGPFGTVLGPDSDPHHRDHFHFDTARYRSGAYCR